MKYLKFTEELKQMVIEGKKDTTWRIDDEKEITVNDQLSLQGPEGKEFSQAKALWVKMTTFDRLTREDREGYESFESEEEMYRTYSNYYDLEVGPETEVKVIKFELVNDQEKS